MPVFITELELLQIKNNLKENLEELTSVFVKYEGRRVKVAGWTVVLVSYSRGRQGADYDNLSWNAKVLNRPFFPQYFARKMGNCA